MDDFIREINNVNNNRINGSLREDKNKNIDKTIDKNENNTQQYDKTSFRNSNNQNKDEIITDT
jgi:hypothetical protein